MRARTVFLLVVIVLVAGFAALNWPEFQRVSQLSFGLAIIEAPLGLILLSLLGLTLVVSMLAGGAMHTRHLLDSRNHFKELERQRDLADRAEASRFTELRTHIDTQLKDMRQRDSIAVTEFEKARLETQREIRTQLDAMNRALNTRLAELEARFDGRPAPFRGEPPILGDRVTRERV
ncbi:hypothetical protein [Ramlibacter sp.]|uniref:hypothetical protein n=1 Tax=Ramlibacter sp. TaxID=1917967 RepID=UPI003D143DFB